MNDTTWAAARRTVEAFNRDHGGVFLQLAEQACEPLAAAEIEPFAAHAYRFSARTLFAMVRKREPTHAELVRTGQQLARMGFAYHKHRTLRIWHLDTRTGVTQTDSTQ